MDKIQTIATLGIILLALAGVLDYTQKGGWKLLILAILYGVANTIIFVAK
jgi:hypothetical protein